MGNPNTDDYNSKIHGIFQMYMGDAPLQVYTIKSAVTSRPMHVVFVNADTKKTLLMINWNDFQRSTANDIIDMLGVTNDS